MGLNRGSVALAFLVSLMAIVGACSGAVYRVGDSAGWTDNGSVDYNEWASSKIFHVGDTIVFEYDAQFHNVKQVTHHEFRSCNVTSPKATYSSGSDSITLKRRPTHLYFVCGFPGHCQAGQKVDIRVLPSFLGPTGSPSPSPSGLPQPAHKSAATSALYYSSSLGSVLLVALGLWMVGFAY
ncbi:hypothetical protein HS088_TW06G00448 [Tripterygium wilfordii]|uniref:Phytocyanin domain-containing protein n=1 Tax=Tripterygium wilfordii TaxID=458696 RepID=A0A7J7DIZ8_TRIWF|nr:mavicyanin-like [Tripterygium wilfordii]KAF5746278.1 hypothetical protein HS088_TW06G00448 [Tripterygium wilfordii]